MADVTFEALRSEGFLSLRQQWITGGNDDVEFSLDCGAGFGSPLITLSVTSRGKTVTEEIDVRDTLAKWVNRIADEIEEEHGSSTDN